MQFCRGLCSLFAAVSKFKSNVITKAVRRSIAFAAAAITIGLLSAAVFSNDFSFHFQFLASVADSLPVAGSTNVSQPVSHPALSRHRDDFDKALDILADAAVTDNRLEGFYDRVVKRATGQDWNAEPEASVVPVEKPQAAAQTASTHEQPALLPFLSSKTAPSDSPIKDLPTFTAQRIDPVKMLSLVPPVPDQPRAAASQSDLAGSVLAQNAASPVDPTTPMVSGDLRFELNGPIQKWIDYYTANSTGRKVMQAGLDRSGDYLKMCQDTFSKAGIPQDLVWIAQVESEWKIAARSPAAAAGIWQFIPKTASDYDLSLTGGADERYDAQKETAAAAIYLRDLYTMFGDWSLALAAYNCGEPRLMTAITQNGNPDFWEMSARKLIPDETINYVPKILAAITVASDPDKYGFTTGSSPVVTDQAAW